MRIEHIRIDGFGRLTDFDTGPKTLGSLVVVLGPNESGKSTLFSFLTTALYGFKPASRELSPHVPWGADEAGGEIAVGLSGGGCATIARRLRSSPSGVLTLAEETYELRNRPVRWAGHVPRTVFRQVFAITLAELAGLDEETWASIQDRVLGSMGASDLKSARSVADTLEHEAGEIWRPNRRGNQRLRDLQAEIRALRSKRNEATERDGQIRALVEERDGVALRLKEAREERHREKGVVERVQELLPLKRQVERIAALRRAGGPRSDLVELPEDLVGYREEVASRKDDLTRQLQELEEDLRAPEVTIARFDDGRRAVLTHRDAIAAFVTRASRAADDRIRIDDLEGRLRGLDGQLRTQAERLLDASVTGTVVESVLSPSVELLRDRIQRLRAADREGQASREAVGAAGGPLLTAALGLAGGGAALLAWGLTTGPTVATASGAAALAVGLVLALQSRRPRAATASAPPTDRQELQSDIRAMLADVPIRSEYLDPPGAPLVQALEELQEAVRATRQAEADRELLRTRLEELRAEATEVGSILGRGEQADPVEQDDPVELAHTLDRELREAARAADAAQVAERERARLLRAKEGLGAELAEEADRLAEIDQRIWQLAAGAAGGRPIDVLQKRLDAHARADRLQEELEVAHPDLEVRLEEIREAEEAGVSWAVDDDDLARRKVRIDELDETIEELRGRGDALERDIVHLRSQPTVDSVDSEIDSLREEADGLTRERDRKWLLARLIREADRRFREEHQPDLLRRASEYLKRLTGGRYHRILVDEGNDGDLFRLVGPQLPGPVPLARPISTGTLEQAYLGLRLAIVDHLDQSEERLPLFLDEAFVNWDDERREKGLEVVAEVARSRQVFAFTCHAEMAEQLAGRGACVLRLGR